VETAGSAILPNMIPARYIALGLLFSASLASGSLSAGGAASGVVQDVTLVRTVKSEAHVYDLNAVVLNTSFGAPDAMSACDGCPRGCSTMRFTVNVVTESGDLVMHKWREPSFCIGEPQTETLGFGEKELCFSELKVVVAVGAPGGQIGTTSDSKVQTFSFACESRLIAPLTKLESLEVVGEAPTFFKSTIERTSRPIGACFSALVEDAPGLGGEIQVAMVVETDGSVSADRIVKNTTGSSVLAECVTDAVGKIRSRKPKAQVTAVATYSFLSE